MLQNFRYIIALTPKWKQPVLVNCHVKLTRWEVLSMQLTRSSLFASYHDIKTKCQPEEKIQALLTAWSINTSLVQQQWIKENVWLSSSFPNTAELHLSVFNFINASGESLLHFKCPLRYRNPFFSDGKVRRETKKVLKIKSKVSFEFTNIYFNSLKTSLTKKK